MSAQSFDPDKFKAAGKKGWDSAAAGWKKWWEVFENGAGTISDHLVTSTGIKPGGRVLDVATGIGEPAVTAARRVGESGFVLATDYSPEMLGVAKERAAANGLNQMDFKVTDCDKLDIAEKDFNAILCRWGLMFFPDPQASLERMRSLLAPGGKVAIAVWAEPQKCPSIGLPVAVISKRLNAPPPPPGMPGPFAMADTGKLERIFKGAGFRDIQIESRPVTFAFSSPADFTQFIKDVASPIKAMLDGETEERQAQVWAAVTDAVKEYAAPDGGVSMENQSICVTASRD